MGLDINSKSKFKYHASYGGIHHIRYLAYLICGGEKDYGSFMSMNDGYFSEPYVEYPHQNVKLKESHFDWGYFIHLLKFPNLTWHSDCGGTYTKNGKVESFSEDSELLTGNSIELLKELKIIGKYKKNTQRNDGILTICFIKL